MTTPCADATQCMPPETMRTTCEPCQSHCDEDEPPHRSPARANARHSAIREPPDYTIVLPVSYTHNPTRSRDVSQRSGSAPDLHRSERERRARLSSPRSTAPASPSGRVELRPSSNTLTPSPCSCSRADTPDRRVRSSRGWDGTPHAPAVHRQPPQSRAPPRAHTRADPRIRRAPAPPRSGFHGLNFPGKRGHWRVQRSPTAPSRSPHRNCTAHSSRMSTMRRRSEIDPRPDPASKAVMARRVCPPSSTRAARTIRERRRTRRASSRTTGIPRRIAVYCEPMPLSVHLWRSRHRKWGEQGGWSAYLDVGRRKEVW